MNTGKKKKRQASDKVSLPSKRHKPNPIETGVAVPTKKVIQLSSSSSLSEFSWDDADVAPPSSSEPDPSMAHTLSLLRSVQEKVNGLTRSQSRAASQDFAVHDTEEDVTMAPTLVKLRVQTHLRVNLFSLKRIDKIKVLRDHLSGLLSCTPEEIQLRFYEMVVDPQKTPNDYGLQNNDILYATVQEKKPVKNHLSASGSTDRGKINLVDSPADFDEGEDEDEEAKEFERELEMMKAQANPEKAKDENKIKLRVKFPDAPERKFRIGIDDTFSKIYDSINKENPGKKLILLFEGESLEPSDTPGDMDMEGGEQIDARFA
eukprot:TRINITY_DN6093_c0_g3_i2.p1 TRINITY_DN6093_c0_g3~~TRINITY_DN6093_c0_g3_i2.p1  ORF type:complete len:361 (+),score=65.01 TRINITY_DN6093_c0_g3_i2:132-1085(+)